MKLKDIVDTDFYLFHILREVLAEEGLPCTHPTMLKYEKVGLIKKPSGGLNVKEDRYRLYTGAELKQAVEIIRQNEQRKSTKG